MQFHEDSRVTKNLLALINLMLTSHEITKKKLRNENQFIENILSLFKLPSNLIAGKVGLFIMSTIFIL